MALMKKRAGPVRGHTGRRMVNTGKTDVPPPSCQRSLTERNHFTALFYRETTGILISKSTLGRCAATSTQWMVHPNLPTLVALMG